MGEKVRVFICVCACICMCVKHSKFYFIVLQLKQVVNGEIYEVVK